MRETENETERERERKRERAGERMRQATCKRAKGDLLRHCRSTPSTLVIT